MQPAQSRLITVGSSQLSGSEPIERFATVPLAIQDLYGDFIVNDLEVSMKFEPTIPARFQAV
jgi:hypothetical protein